MKTYKKHDMISVSRRQIKEQLNIMDVEFDGGYIDEYLNKMCIDNLDKYVRFSTDTCDNQKVYLLKKKVLNKQIKEYFKLHPDDFKKIATWDAFFVHSEMNLKQKYNNILEAYYHEGILDHFYEIVDGVYSKYENKGNVYYVNSIDYILEVISKNKKYIKLKNKMVKKVYR